MKKRSQFQQNLVNIVASIVAQMIGKCFDAAKIILKLRYTEVNFYATLKFTRNWSCECFYGRVLPLCLYNLGISARRQTFVDYSATSIEFSISEEVQLLSLSVKLQVRRALGQKKKIKLRMLRIVEYRMFL